MAQPIAPDAIQNLLVEVTSRDGFFAPWFGELSTCSGAVVQLDANTPQERYFVTAAHCPIYGSPDSTLEISESATSINANVKTQFKKTIVRIGDGLFIPDLDVFILPLKTDQLTHTRTLIARTNELQANEQVYFMGYPDGTGPVMSSCSNLGGNLTSIRRRPFLPEHDLICYVERTTVEGASGGPVIDENGHYLGFLSHGRPEKKKLRFISHSFRFASLNRSSQLATSFLPWPWKVIPFMTTRTIHRG